MGRISKSVYGQNHEYGSSKYGHNSGNRMPLPGLNPNMNRASHALLGAPGSKSIQGVSGAPVNHGVQVMDEEGNDVTPLALSAPVKPAHAAPRGHGGASATEVSIASMTKETVADVLNNLETLTMGSWNASVMRKSNMSFSQTSRGSGASSPDNKDDDASLVSSTDSMEEKDEGEVTIERARRSSTAASGDQLAGLSEDELNELMHIQLEETETIWLFELPSVAVSNDFTEEAATLLNSRQNNENFTDRGMQTFNNFLKNKDVQASGPEYNSTECQVTQWTIYDAYRAAETSENGGPKHGGDKDGDLDPMPGLEPSAAEPPTAIHNAATGVGDSIMLPTAGQGPTLAKSDFNSGSIMASRSVYLNEDTMSEANYHPGAGTGAQGIDPLMSAIGFSEFGAGATTEREMMMLASLNQDSLRNSLLIMERAVVGNSYEKKHLLYRNIDEDEINARNAAAAAAALMASALEETQAANGENGDGGGTDGAGGSGGEGDENFGDGSQEVENVDAVGVDGEGSQEEVPMQGVENDEADSDSMGTSISLLTALWSYRCELTRGRTVTYMAWNKHNEDILAVAYSESKMSSNISAGLILCWSPKNPEWPERVFKSNTAVTAIDFSRANPNLLAVGFADGRISIYDVRRKEDTPVLDNSELGGKHRDPVWELKWVDRERVIGDDQSRGETLVSVSTDGRVCQWLIRKGLEYTDLMTLKRVTRQQEIKATGAGSINSSTGGSKTSAFIARQAGGLCFDFNPNDSNIYLVGTEDGHIHRCSCSYNEQYLSTQFGHTGAVYKVKWSPFSPGHYLTCSADWTVRMWADDEEEAIFKFQSGKVRRLSGNSNVDLIVCKDAITDVTWSPTNSTVFGCVSNDGRMEIWDLQFSVLDPAILHTVLDRRLTSIIFASRSPTVLIGDDNGAVSVFNLKGGSVGKMAATLNFDSAIGPTGTAGLPRHIVDEQVAILRKVLKGKNLSNAANAVATTA
ncbi:WD repeat-containing protein 78 [Irineochytrium annulatum]|nr:WD repeat-containing protein 78 [Irineochytrium annulatum]